MYDAIIRALIQESVTEGLKSKLGSNTIVIVRGFTARSVSITIDCPKLGQANYVIRIEEQSRASAFTNRATGAAL